MNTRITRILTLSLGSLWILDGILQLQPAMFTSAFVQSVLAPNLTSQPHIIAAIVAFGIRIFSINIVLNNFLSALIQLAIGLLLVLPLRKNFRRFGLWLSVAWSLIVWIFGEGFGNLATGSATFYTGAPGAVLLYLILALFLLDADDNPSAIEKLPRAAGVMFVALAALNLVPMFWQPTMLSMLASVPVASNWLGTFASQETMIGNFLAVDVLVCLGIFLLILPNRAAAWTAIAFLVVVWWIGQNFGGIQTFPFGTATDVNSAPLFVLFILPALMKTAPPQGHQSSS